MSEPSESLSPAAQAYLARLQRLTDHVDPLVETDAAVEIRAAARDLEQLPNVDVPTLVGWVSQHPTGVNTLALAVGLSQEKLKNLLKAQFDTQSWAKVARTDPQALVDWLDNEYDLVDTLRAQLGRLYTLGDVLAARGVSRQTASRAGAAGRLIENAVEEIVVGLDLPYRMRGRFTGQNGRTAPADVVLPDTGDGLVAVACKGFDSTGSKLTAAVAEIHEMAQVRYGAQFVFAVVDGIGWASRQADFRSMFALAENNRIDGLYALADLDKFREDLVFAAQKHRLMP